MDGLVRFDNMRKKYRMKRAYYFPPPSLYKDWNEYHIKSSETIFEYVSKTMVEVDDLLIHSKVESWGNLDLI